jgi:hypothetical protein
MAKLSDFHLNVKAMREGEWVSMGAEFGDLEIKTKAMGDGYHKMQSDLLRREARLAGGEDKIPAVKKREINVKCLVECCLLDVRGLTQDDGVTPVSFKEFCELLAEEAYAEMAVLALRATIEVGTKRAAKKEEAKGNLASSPNGSSATAASV